MKGIAVQIAVVLATVLMATSALAEDLNPPSWRGNPNTSWVQYEFDDPDDFQDGVNGPPYTPGYNDGYLPFGDPTLTHIPGAGLAGWQAKQPTWENGGTGGPYDPAGLPGDGWINLSGEIIIELQNDTEPRPHKEIWLQFVWEPQGPGNQPTVQITDPFQESTTIPLRRDVLWDEDPTNEWRKVYHDTWHLDIFPNPAQETISIRGGINIDEVVVDTWCVPEPATLGLLGLGIAGLALRRRRK